MRTPVAASLFLCFLLPACEYRTDAVEAGPVVSITVRNLPEPDSGGHYALWAAFHEFNRRAAGDAPLHEGGYVHLGDFVVRSHSASPLDPSGGPVRLHIPAGDDPQLLDDMIITLEPASGTGEEPGSVLLGGEVTGTAAEGRVHLTLSSGDAFGTDFAQTSGVSTLVTPSSPGDSNAGVWFVSNPSTGQAGLRGLPRAPEGWTYEGWVVDRLTPGAPLFYSTGKFVRPDSADADGAGPGSTPGPGFAAPGQDFLAGGLIRPDLSSARFALRVTLEPWPDPSPAPFPFPLLSSEDLVTPPPEQRTRPLANLATRRVASADVVVRR